MVSGTPAERKECQPDWGEDEGGGVRLLNIGSTSGVATEVTVLMFRA
jgi:hypothetical protein